MVDGVVERSGAAHFTSCVPEYGRDEAFQRRYAAAARTSEDWAMFRTEWLDLSEDDYQARRAVGS
jgi:glutaconate CoA-transferase subunit A